MTEFRVHFIKTDGNKTTHVVNAESPAQAAAIIRKKNPGVTVLKVKVNKAGNVSPRDRGRTITDDDIKAIEKHAEKHYGKPPFVRSSEPGWLIPDVTDADIGVE